MDTNFWTAINAIATLVSACCTGVSVLILLSTVILVFRELEEIRKANYASAYKMAHDILQANDIRLARDVVLKNLANKSFDTWDDSEIAEARKVCQSYDAVGQMIRSGMLPVKTIADSWGASLRESWHILAPMVFSFRAKINAAEYWDDFEWLASQTESYQRRLYKE
jgi:hypothetical protein